VRFSRLLVTAIVFGLALFVGPAQLAHGATLTVTKTADTADGVCDSDCSLREAIVASNAALATFDTIDFSGLGAGTQTFTFSTKLPEITDPVHIDGTTAVSYVGAAPVIVLDGTGLSAKNGLEITTVGSTVRALAIVSFHSGIKLNFPGGSNSVFLSYFGMDPDGTTVRGNALGIWIASSPNNIIGGPGLGNLISGNDSSGILIDNENADSNVVKSNIIGLDITATVDKGNVTGVSIVGGADSNVIGAAGGEGNVISGNDFRGVQINGVDSTFNTVAFNHIGTDAASTVALANGVGVGLLNSAPSNTIGPGNVVAFNTDDGVRIEGAAILNTVTGNSIHDNAGLGINNLLGGNTELTPPTVTAAGSASGSSDCASCTIEVFSDDDDEGKTFHGTATTAAGTCPCAWSFTGAVTGPNVTATVTDGSGNTSEFSASFACSDADIDTVCDSGDSCPNDATNDVDGDGICGESDNCPSWPNPGQSLPPWTVPVEDDDCDAFTATIETFVGTDPDASCASTAAANDEADDRWPADTNDNQFINVFDVVPYIAALNSSAPGPPYTARLDLDMSGDINTFDVVPFIQLLNKGCLP